MSWLGITDKAWFEVEIPQPVIDLKAETETRIKRLIEESSIMLNSTLTKSQWQSWVEYQQKLQNIPLQADYPQNIFWPTKPE